MPKTVMEKFSFSELKIEKVQIIYSEFNKKSLHERF